MRTFRIESFLENKSLEEISKLFFEAYDNVCECAIELLDISRHREELEAEEGGSIEQAENTVNHFYENSCEAMAKAFHRIVGLKLSALDPSNEKERILTISPEDQNRFEIPFDSIHELSLEGNIWFTRGWTKDTSDDDELDAVRMKNVVLYLTSGYPEPSRRPRVTNFD